MPLVLTLLLFFLTPASARAEPAINCHCYQDRSFDAKRPAAADPYLLTAAQNSLLAATFSTPKKTVVQAKMKGVSGKALWLAHWSAADTGLSAKEVLQERDKAPSWGALMKSLALSPGALDAQLGRALARDAPDDDLSEAVIDQVLSSRMDQAPEELALLRRKGAGDKEVILATLLARCSGRPASDLLREVNGKRTTWGALLQAQELEPGRMEELWTELLRQGERTRAKRPRQEVSPWNGP
ncbi:MAG: hypothetical protein C0617_12835 [Desulfuromonas sp.]|uniref:hypothetical protein n=1 Tax=Desulfuromonas sp. TaxID=892 RepID=UPI000CC5A814|nr:hypothetical protein [Desulfuromonas sp.]PLX83116.1 MAG: hypothetical protein C0617_12835 [Desulfuromonas sp.]